MLRTSVNFAIVFCLLAFIGTAVLGVRSCTVSDQVTWRGDESTVILTSTRGRVDLSCWAVSMRPHPPMEVALVDWVAGEEFPLYERDAASWFGFSVWRGEQYYTMSWATAYTLQFRAPHWGLCVLELLFPAICFTARRVRRVRRARAGLCRRCGYDLRASGMKCPECDLSRT